MSKVIFSTNQTYAPGKRRCTFCTHKMKEIDYKAVDVLSHFLNGFQDIKKRYYTGVCLNHQRKVAQAIKRARQVALLPFVN